MILEVISVGPMQANCYILAETDNAGAIIIDPGDQERKIRKILEKYALSPALIINTHGHYDHIGCDNNFGVPIYIHRLDLEFLKDPGLNLSGFFSVPYSVSAEIKAVEEKDLISLGKISLEVIHVPGHTPGGISLLMRSPTNKVLFTGDSLFRGSIGRSDFEGGNEEALIRTIKEKLLTLSDDTVVYPGHGEPSTIKEEKENNPFLS